MPIHYENPKPVEKNLRQRMEKGAPAVKRDNKPPQTAAKPTKLTAGQKKAPPPRPKGAKPRASSLSPKPKKKIAGRVDKKKPKK